MNVNRDQWRAFWAAFLSWVLDAFDFNILTFVLIDIQQSLTIDRALAGALGTVTLAMRLVGGTAAGVAADKWGRRLPLMLSLLWFSLFAFLSGLSTSYAMLFAMRALFGIGMGGAYAAGMPLALEHWPEQLRGLASGLLAGGWYWGYLLSAAVFHFVFPLFPGTPDLAWRVMFAIGALPGLALLVWIRSAVQESPVWLARRDPTRERLSLVRIFQRDLIGATLQTCAVASTFMFFYYSLSFWYVTFLRDSGHTPLPYLIAFNAGAIAGTALWGALSQTALGRRGAVSVAVLLALAAIPLYLHSGRPLLLGIGALIMGSCGSGIWGVLPAYLTERFPTAVRGVGSSVAYHFGAAVGATTPVLLGMLQDRGTSLTTAMTVAIVASGLLVASGMWFGPETRGRRLSDGAS